MSQTVDELYLLGEVFELLEAVVAKCRFGPRRHLGNIVHEPVTVRHGRTLPTQVGCHGNPRYHSCKMNLRYLLNRKLYN